MKILLTGGAGFVGSTVAKHLHGDVTVIDNLKTGYLHNLPEGVKFIQADCSDERLLDQITDHYDVVIHIAGQASKEGSFDDVFYDLNANAKSTLVLLELCRKIKCTRFVFISTVCLYGGNTNPGQYNESSEAVFDTFYSIHKFTSEQYFKMYKDIDHTIFRLFTCYGPAQDLTNTKKGMVAIYINQFLNNDRVVIKGSLDRYRDFVYAGDVAEIISVSLENPAFFNETFNIGTGVKTTIRELLDTINTVGQFNKEIIVEEALRGDMYGCYADNTKLLDVLPDFKFKTVEEGISQCLCD
jgi:UDP-glucose 4-epimerase